MDVSLQQTRRYILDILREKREATVDEIVDHLHQRRGKEITPVTVRHHLHLLLQDALIVSPLLRRKSSPGRPQHVYALTEKAKDYFPTNYEGLAGTILEQIQSQFPPATVNVILEGVAESMMADVEVDGLSVTERLAVAVDHLNKQGYDAHLEPCAEGYLLHTRNCPYHQLAQTTHALCDMDMRFVSRLAGVVPRLVARMSDGGSACSYLLPVSRSILP
jgi:predicted ArsR family transcriptional regulator